MKIAALALCLLAVPTAAFPCSVVLPESIPRLEGRVFAGTPLLFLPRVQGSITSTLGPELHDHTGRRIALVEEPRSDLGALRDRFSGEEVTALRPLAPLPDGAYFSNGTRFDVDAATGIDVSAVPVLSLEADAVMHIPGDCGLTSINVAPAPEGEAFLVVVRGDDGTTDRSLAIGSIGEVAFAGFERVQPSHTRFCLSVAGLSPAGELGPERDFGCFDARDGASDPRVVGGGGLFGCTTTRAPAGLAPLFAVAVGALLRSRRRR